MDTYDYNLGLAFETIAKKQPDKKALAFPEGKSYTFTEVQMLSSSLAEWLLTHRLARNQVAAIFNDKSPEAYCLMLACLKIGVIYTNLDVTSPTERIRKILEVCKPSILFYGRESSPDVVAGLAADMNVPFVALSDLRPGPLRDNDQLTQRMQAVTGADPAYLMFTSGSTGFPKGAVMSHSNVLHFIKWGTTTFGITPDDVFTNANPIYFDNSVFDFYVSLFSGASLVPLDAATTKDPRSLVKAINNSGCTTWFSVPSLLVYLLTTKVLSAADFPQVRQVIFGGEGFPKNKLKQLFDMFHNRMKLHNVYGPTECTCICSSYLIAGQDFENMKELAPLGYLAPNFDYEIIPHEQDDRDYGELALMGPCVGLGYYNDPDLTNKSFVQNPAKGFHQRMYKTGDLVRRMPNGHLHFKGRVDNQIKHMGYRIELEEIEAALASIEYINEAGVIYERLSPELGQIKAFVSLADASKQAEDVLGRLRGLLPPYMIPRVVIMESLPKNRNGKIDRKQLA